MAVMNIVTFPDKRLLCEAKVVNDIDGKLQQLIDSMAETMYCAPGIGLAANQVGEDCRLIVYDLSPDLDNRGKWEALVNPVIVESEGEIVSEEGCLSVVDYRAEVRRAARVCVQAYDRHGNPVERECEDMLAIVMQHEIDHLHGALFIDRISKLKRNLYIKRRMKQLKAEAND